MTHLKKSEQPVNSDGLRGYGNFTAGSQRLASTFRPYAAKKRCRSLCTLKPAY
jgi:hypothetical protein